MDVGPRAMSHAQRVEISREIADRVHARYGNQVMAIGLYGSVARGADGPFSDIEMRCVLRTVGEEFGFEWSTGPWKAEVNVCSEDVILREAATVEGTWPLTHGAFLTILPLFDPECFFERLRDVITGQPEEKFRVAIEETLVGEIYELVGKLRNARVAGSMACIPELAVSLARHGAYVIGLAHRYTYSTGSRVFAEALTQPDRPSGFDALCHLVMSGNLADPETVAAACEACWSGLVTWAERHRFQMIATKRIPF